MKKFYKRINKKVIDNEFPTNFNITFSPLVQMKISLFTQMIKWSALF